MTDILSSLHK